jgi:hypothetical protein
MLQIENKEKCMVEELTEILPYNSPNTVSLFLRVLEAIPREVSMCICTNNNIIFLNTNNHNSMFN